ncbi:MAG: N-ethylammeline chlorohydrolase [Alteromonadaceae bacterium]|nr:MAG: N-ethylammeline chlorohydrolase [Alteromonadaceae bacterium]
MQHNAYTEKPVQNVDLIIHATWMIPIIPRDTVLQNQAIVVDNGNIIDICNQGESTLRYQTKELITLDEYVVLPGLINTQAHGAMSLVTTNNSTAKTSLEQHLWPIEQTWCDEAFIHDGLQLAMAKMLSSGTTYFSDMYFFPKVAASAVHEVGMRAQISFPILDASNAWASDADDHISKGLSLYDHYGAHPLINIAFGPYSASSVSDQTLNKIATYTNELQANLQIRLHETVAEIQQSMALSGKRPSQRLADFGLLTPHTQCLNMAHIDDGDIALLQLGGSHVVVCPSANTKYQHSAQRLIDADINACISTGDGTTSKNLDILNEVQLATLLNKPACDDGSTVSAGRKNAITSLEMATINGARALGREETLGSIEVGKQADLCAIALDGLNHIPQHDPINTLTSNTSGLKASHVWVKGRCLLQNHQLTTIDERKLRQRVQYWQQLLSPTSPSVITK